MRGRSTERGQSSSHKHGRSKSRSKKNLKCYNCGKNCHLKKDCWSLNKNSNPQGNTANTSDDGDALCCEALTTVEGIKRYAGIWLINSGATYHMTLKKRMVFRGVLVVLKGEKIAANVYMLKGETLLEAKASVTSCSSDSAMLWHQKLGHMSEQGMKVLVEKKLLPCLTNVSLLLCEHCISSEQHRFKFNTSNSRAKSVLELVHSDVWKALVTSLGGAKYFVSFIDDYSRRCWVYPIKKKSDVFSTFKNFKARVELDSGNKIKCFRTYNGGEYTSEEFDDFYRKEGIKRQFTVANTPQQNGVAEQMNRTLLERTRAMLRDTCLEKSFWAEAVNTACYLVNRAPSTAIELKTPIEMWTGKPANYSNLHVFGSIVYMMYNSQEISKLDPKSRKCKFLGYADGVKGYRLWDPTARKIHVEKDVEQGDSSKAELAHDEQEPESSEAPTTRQSDHVRRRPNWHSDYVIEGNIAYCLLTEDGEPSTYQETINSSDASLWMMAMQEEIEALHKNNTWDLVPLPQGMKPIVREVLAICAIWNLHLEQLDVKTAFLHGNLEEEIYMLQPEGFEEKEKKNLVCRVEQISVRSKAGVERSGDNDFVILLLYVDDMLVAGPNKDHIEELNAQLARKFEMKDLGSENKILGMQIHRDRSNRKIWLSQKNYLKKILSRFSMQDCKPISTPLPINFKLSSSMSPSSEEERMEMSRVPYASAVGSLMFAMICTRPYIAQAVGVSVVVTSTTEAEYVAAIQASKEAIWLKMLLEELGHNQELVLDALSAVGGYESESDGDNLEACERNASEKNSDIVISKGQEHPHLSVLSPDISRLPFAYRGKLAAFFPIPLNRHFSYALLKYRVHQILRHVNPGLIQFFMEFQKNETPELPKHKCLTLVSKPTSPNCKRVPSTPKRRPCTSSSLAWRSRKLILRSIPSFPHLLHHEKSSRVFIFFIMLVSGFLQRLNFGDKYFQHLAIM
ncbi:hypothetical protein F3Y22_tig00111403pilonHSYRG00065 [Hibiscus syriacus]|uniref:Integrase catalytic domain-containing protein n=1 Tax=Hibiscus syriacus TaxID=106335 RepID=A0A6A2Y3Y0_HIBSY|nr:hypothetical protein F3Y22_tig00111403pilonHSYRG00065 [Hibiscus syriacus]